MLPEWPTTEDREWLDEQLFVLLRRVGWERFVSAPRLLPNDEFFPDPYEHGARGVGTVARRLLWYADSGDARVWVRDLSKAKDDKRIETWDLDVASVSPEAVEIHVVSIGRAVDLPGALSHELARAWRALRGLNREPEDPYRSTGREIDADLELQLSSLTAVYLGWGTVAACAAEQIRTARRRVGRYFHEYEVRRISHGGLAPAEMSYLLAVQSAVRGDRAAEVQRIRDALSANEQGRYAAWCEALDGRKLRERLAIPDGGWPECPFRLPPEPFLEDGAGVKVIERPPEHARRPVFRVRRHRAVPGSVAGVLCGGVLSGALMGMGAPTLPTPAQLGILLTSGALGWLLGRIKTRDECSHCRRNIPEHLEQCPPCGGIIAGSIKDFAERLDAEERLDPRWYVEHGVEPPASPAPARRLVPASASQGTPDAREKEPADVGGAAPADRWGRNRS